MEDKIKSIQTFEYLPPRNVPIYDEELFENLLIIWQYKGSQPTRRDLASEISNISKNPYERRFITWLNALKCFIEYANEKEIFTEIKYSSENSTKTSRDASLRIRFKVLTRDNFMCVKCGARPAKEQNIQLHVDHIIPWAKSLIVKWKVYEYLNDGLEDL